LKKRTPSRITATAVFFRKGEKDKLKLSGHRLIKKMIRRTRIIERKTKREVAIQRFERTSGPLSSMGFRILLAGNRSKKNNTRPKMGLGLRGLAMRWDRRKWWMSHEERKTIGMIWGIKCRGILCWMMAK
jgi:hypothetical protein